MAQSTWEHTSEQIADTAHRATRAASAVADALGDGVGSARRAAKQSSDAVVDLFDDTKRRIRSHPVESAAVTFAAGIAAGAALAWVSRRRQR